MVPQYAENSSEKSDEDEDLEPEIEEKSSNDPDYEELHEDSELAAGISSPVFFMAPNKIIDGR